MDLQNPIHELARSRPNLWRDVELAVADYHQNGTQPYFLPAKYWMDLSSGVDDWRWPSMASALIPWRYSQRVYKFDSDLFRKLTESPVNSALPVEVLRRVPDWSIYIDWSHDEDVCHELGQYAGAWVRVGDDLHGSDDLLQAVFYARDGLTISQQMSLVTGKSIPEIIREKSNTMSYQKQGDLTPVAESTDTAITGAMGLIGRLMPLVLFLCTDEPEIEKLHIETSQRLNCKRRIQGITLKTPKRPMVYDVGVEFGRSIRTFETERRAARESGVTPHIRRAHWHTYLTGPKHSERKRIMRWIPPLMIGINQDTT